MGHGASLSIEDALEMAEADYYQGERPAGTTAIYPINEGTGTSIAGTVIGSTAGTLSSGTWVASGRYKKPCDYGYVKQRFDSRTANVTTTYTATYWEAVSCDPTAGGFTVTLPSATAHDDDRVRIYNASTSTNTITISGAIDAASITTSRGSLEFEARNGNWYPV
jgi:hypothetical protein